LYQNTALIIDLYIDHELRFMVFTALLVLNFIIISFVDEYNDHVVLWIDCCWKIDFLRIK